MWMPLTTFRLPGKSHLLLLVGALVAMFGARVSAGELLDISDAVVVVDDAHAGTPSHTAATVLVQEIAERTGLGWGITDRPEPEAQGAIIQLSVNPEGLADEGFRVTTGTGRVAVEITGADRRGVLYGVGWLLRNAALHRGRVEIPVTPEFSTAPAFAIRGHQLGYRHTANSWDAWGLEQYDRYIRELALFGANAIENTAFDQPNDLMKLSPRDMSAGISRICRKYGLDYWYHFAAPDDPTDPEARRKRLAESDSVFRVTPHLDHVFVPGGDPGEAHPRDLFPYMEELNELLHKYHPEAKIWFSLQKYDAERTDYALSYMEREQPDWIEGVVDGPWGPPVELIRARLPEQYPIRAYPDITHNMRSQFPVPWWDPALYHTNGREGSNPRPIHYSLIHKATSSFTDGFIAYSDGVHDDVNKVVWLQLAWDPDKHPRDILVEYARFFFNTDVAEEAADGILALERNWEGSIEENGSIEATYQLWNNLAERSPDLAGNWRWQLCLLRARYDAYMRYRAINEYHLQTEADEILSNATERGSDAVMTDALTVLQKAETEPVHTELRQNLVDLCEALFQSVGLQTSVAKYGARNSERGAVLDFIDLPLNDRWWYEDQFQQVAELSSEAEKVERLMTIATWEHPGPGSYYDDIGNVARSPHVLRGESIHTDPTFIRTAIPHFMKWDGGFSRQRKSWQSNMHWPEGIVYRGLDPEATFVVRLTGHREIVMRMNGHLASPSVNSTEIGEFRLYPVPPELIADGMLTLTFDDLDAGNVHWREWSRLNEVWLLKQ